MFFSLIFNGNKIDCVKPLCYLGLKNTPTALVGREWQFAMLVDGILVAEQSLTL